MAGARNGVNMAAIQQQIDVAAQPTDVRTIWGHFVEWAHTGQAHLLCSDLACVDAVRSGLVEFVPTTNGRTTVIFRMLSEDNGITPEELKRQLGHDLVVFKDYVERSGLAHRRPTNVEEVAMETESDRHGDPPRHTQLSSEDGTTFWRHHFPT
jgi:hypothetical protein